MAILLEVTWKLWNRAYIQNTEIFIFISSVHILKNEEAETV